MEKKSYGLVAWTVEGGIRMVPSLVKLASEDYLTRIEKIENSAKCGMSEEEEIEWILALSRAYEQLADFYLMAGLDDIAYEAFRESAFTCLCCTDILWLTSLHYDVPVAPLSRRFLAMHRRAKALTYRSPALKLKYKGSDLEEWFLMLTYEDRLDAEEIRNYFRRRKAWHFGTL